MLNRMTSSKPLSQNKQRMAEIRRRAKTDLFFFCREVLGYKKMSPVPHREVTNLIQYGKKRKKLILMPRGSFKSSVVTIGTSLYHLTQNPNCRILISHELQKLAKNYVKEIKGHIESNEKFRAIFGDLVNKNDTWRDDSFVINGRTQNRKEPSVTSGSLEKGVAVGMHYDYIFLDDPVSSNNSKSIEQVEKTIEYYRLLLSILEPDGKLYICGTRWHMDDLYGWILDERNSERANFDVIIERAQDEKGKLLMPNVLTEGFLKEVRASQGEEIYNHQYLNNPVSITRQTFNIDDVQFYEKPPQGLINFITVDCAISLRKRADYTAVIVNGVDYHHNYYIREAFQDKLKPYETVEKIFEFAEKYGPIMGLGIETNALDQSIKNILLEEMGKRNCFIPIIDIKIDPAIKKADRIRWLSIKTKNKSLFIKKEHEELYEQIKRHPQTAHDDLLDALKSQVKITFPSDSKPDQQTDHLDRLSLLEKKEYDNIQKVAKKRRMIKRRNIWNI